MADAPPAPVRTDWRAAVRARIGLVVAALLLVAILVASSLLSRPGEGERPTTVAWRALGVRTMELDSADLRSVTHRWTCARAGDAGYVDGACDPWSRPFNYPSVWLAPAGWGWGPEATRPLALLEIALLFAALWTLFPARGWKAQAAAGALALSPPVMFAVERGNVDMLVFAGLVLGLNATRALPEARRDGARAALFATLAFLKIFPIAAFATLARSRRGLAWALAGGAATAVALAVAYRETLPLLQGNMTHEFDTNYGRMFLFGTDAAASPWRSPAGLMSLAVAALAATAGSMLAVRRREAVRAAFGDLLSGEPLADLAAAGVAVFAFTFLLGMNYDYRLIFLLPVLPLLFALDGGRWTTPAGAVAAVLMARLMLAHRWPDLALAVVDWALFTGAVAWASASAWDRVVAPRATPAGAAATA